MSYHVKNPELDAKLALQRRKSTVISILIAILGCIIVALALTLILLNSLFKETLKVVTYSPVEEEVIAEVPQEVTEKVTRKPSAPASAMAKVIASQSQSSVVLPVPDVDVTSPSIEFGNNDDFGDGWGSDTGVGKSGGAVSFFKQNIEANRIAYVIDFSRSMRGAKEKLMRQELIKSIEALPSGVQFSVIAFSGPVWYIGDQITPIKTKDWVGKSEEEKNLAEWEIKHRGKTYTWKREAERHVYQSDPAMPPAPWYTSTSGRKKIVIKDINETKLVWGTSWFKPLELALDMDPKPDVIFFMTDGSVPDTKLVTEEIAVRARREKVVINTIAIDEPKARKAMSEVAKKSRGQFSLVDKTGELISQ